jgi:hypothetical protein
MAVEIFVNRLHAAIPLQVKYGESSHQDTFLLIGDLIDIIRLFHLMPEIAIHLGQLRKDRPNIPFDFRKGISLFLVNLVRLEFEPFLGDGTIKGVTDKLVNFLLESLFLDFRLLVRFLSLVCHCFSLTIVNLSQRDPRVSAIESA